MRLQFLARVCFAGSLFLWSIAGSTGLTASAWGALGALLISLPLAWYGGGLSAALKDRYLLITATLFVVVNIATALATALLPLTVFAVINQSSPLIAFLIAPHWGEKAVKSDWALVALGICGAVLVIGGNLSVASPAGFLAALVVIIVVSISAHRWGQVARNGDHHWAAATAVLFLPAILLFPLSAVIGQSPAPEHSGILLYLAGGALLAIGNGAMYISYIHGWSVVRSLILKPLSALFLVAAGIVFLGDPLTWGTAVGGAMILVASILVGRQQRSI